MNICASREYVHFAVLIVVISSLYGCVGCRQLLPALHVQTLKLEPRKFALHVACLVDLIMLAYLRICTRVDGRPQQ